MMLKASARVVATVAIAAGATLLLAPGAMAQNNAPAKPAPAAQGIPSPKILVLDRNAILANSKVGKDIVRQVNEYTEQAKKEFKGENDALRSEGQQLQQQIAILAPNVKQQKIAAFEKKQQAFQQKVEARQQQIQGGVAQARQKVEQALGPILQGIMNERGGNLLLDRNAVILGNIDVDITRTAIQRLDQKMPTVKVALVAPPSGDNSQGQ